MKTKALRILQTALGLKAEEVNGVLGTQTANRIKRRLQSLNPNTKTDRRAWPLERQAVICLQALCQKAGFDAGELDGLWGPQTSFACDQLAHQQTHGAPPEPWLLNLPYPLKLSWDLGTLVRRTRCNAKVRVSLGRTPDYDWMHVQAARN